MSDFNFFMWKLQPSPLPPEKIHPLFPSNPLNKLRSCQASPFLKIWLEVQRPLPQQKGVGCILWDFPIVWPIISVYFLDQSPPNISTNFQAHYLTYWFSSHLDNYSPSSLIYFPSPGNLPIVRSLFQSFSLSSSHISTNFHAHCIFHRFSSPSVNSSPTSFIHFPTPGKSFQLFFQSVYSACFFSLFIQ